jgi:alkylation response protein AidB-like acyl-CoA dehydrogenase
MDFQFTDEQNQLRSTAREFAEREILPHVMEWDEASHFPLEVIKQIGRLGLMGVIFPPELGGAGMGYVEYVIAIEELSRVDGSVGISPRTRRCARITFFWSARTCKNSDTFPSSQPPNSSAPGD